MSSRLSTIAASTLAALTVLAGLVTVARPVAAHTPHDDVFGVAVSPTFATDGTVIVVSRGIAYRSVDGARGWERLVVGLDNRNPLSHAAVTCCEAPTFLVASPGDGVFRSDDTGERWTRANAGLASRQVTHLTASPAPQGPVFVVADEVLYRSDDAGRSWVAMDQPATTITSIGLSTRAPDEVLLGEADGDLHRSDDGGRTWSTQTIEGAGAIGAIARTGSETVLVGTDQKGLLRSGDDLTTLEPVTDEAVADQAVSSIAAEGVDGDGSDGASSLWVSLADTGAVRSDDGGASWSIVDDGLTKSSQADEESYEDRPHFGDIVVARGSSGEVPTVLLGGFDGFFVLDPGATSWREAQLMQSQIVVGLAVSPDYADDRTVAVTTYMNGATLSTDGGASWTPINTGLEEEVLYRSGEDRFARLFGIAFSPDYTDDRTLVAARWTDMLSSTDSGATWEPVAVLPGEDPPLQQFTFSVSSDGERTLVLTGSRDGGVHRSSDGGRSYELASRLEGPIRSIVPVGRSDGAVSVLAATAGGIYASDDTGSRWSSLTREVTNTTNLAPSPGFATDRTVFAATRNGLFRSVDGGRSWSAISAPAPLRNGFVEGVAVAPTFTDDGLVLASVRGRGLYRSTDGGQTFAPVGRDLSSAQLELSNYPNATAVPIVFSPTFGRDRTVFGYSNATVVRSVDGGASWETLDIPRATHDEVPPAQRAQPGRRSSAARAGGALAVVALAAAIGWGWYRRRRSTADSA